MDTYKINIEGLDRELRKFPVNDKLDIAAFIMFGHSAADAGDRAEDLPLSQLR